MTSAILELILKTGFSFRVRYLHQYFNIYPHEIKTLNPIDTPINITIIIVTKKREV